MLSRPGRAGIADGARGFDLWVGGGLSTNPMIAQRLGAFVEPDRVPDVWRGVTAVFRDYGYRRLRSRARLKFLLADWGPQRFREVLETEYLRGPLPVRGRVIGWRESRRRRAGEVTGCEQMRVRGPVRYGEKGPGDGRCAGLACRR